MTATPSEATPPPAPRIVVGVDGSSSARDALRWAAAYAAAVGASIDAYIAWQPAKSRSGGGRSWAKQLVDATVQAVAKDFPEQHMECVIVEGLASAVLIEAAEGADLLVVGAKGIAGHEGDQLGSVSSAVVSDANCAVVVARQPRHS